MNDLKDFRGPLPLDDDDFAAIRAAVMSKIERRQPTASAWLALAASVMVAVMSFVVAHRPAVAPQSRPLTRRFAPPSPRFAGRGALEVPSPRASGEKVAEGRMRGRRHHRPKTPPHQVARIEIHTADPDIRIIWIAN